MTVYSGLPLFYRYVQNLNQEISGVPTGTPDALFFPGTGEVSFVSTYTAEQWRKIFDCILFGADFLYPDESHNIMFSWLKQVEWPQQCEALGGDMLLYVPPTGVSNTMSVDIQDIPQNYAHMRLDFAFESTYGGANYDDLKVSVYPSHSYLYYSSGAYRSSGGAWGYYQTDESGSGFRIRRCVSGQGASNVRAAAGYLDFPFYSRSNEDWYQQVHGMGNYIPGRNGLGNWQFSGLLDGHLPIERIVLGVQNGPNLADGTYSLTLWGELPE